MGSTEEGNQETEIMTRIYKYALENKDSQEVGLQRMTWIAEGDRVCNFGRYVPDGPPQRLATLGPGWKPDYTGVIYVAKRRSDGVLTWRQDGYFGGEAVALKVGIRPENIDQLMTIAPHPWCSWAVHGKEVYLEKKVVK